MDFGGYLGTEMKNITFPGERAAGEQMLRKSQTYEDHDRPFPLPAVGLRSGQIASEAG